MKLKMMIILFFLVILCFPCYADNTVIRNQTDLQKYCESVMDYFQHEKIHDAFILLREQYPFPADFDSVELQTVQQWTVIKNRFGKVLDYKLIKMETIQDAGLVKYLYIMRYENSSLRFLFLFYKPDSKWILNSFDFDDKIKELFTF